MMQETSSNSRGADMETLVSVAGIALIVFGAVRSRTAWGKPALALGILILAVSVYLGWPDAVAGYKAGIGVESAHGRAS
jgi:hypothetical protein